MLRRPSPSMLVALLALFVALGGTSYAALTISGKNVKNGSLTGADVKNNSLTGKDVTSITGSDVKNGSITGADVKESALGKVPSAAASDTAGNANALGGQPLSALANQSTVSRPFAASCAPAAATFVDCGSTSVTLARTGRLVMLGELFYGNSTDATPAGTGRCRYVVDGTPAAESPSLAASDAKGVTLGAPFNAQTDPIPAGSHTVGLQCNSTKNTVSWSPARVTVLTVSPN